jgi:beta-glucosidase
MTLEEKIDYIGGTGFAVRAMPNLGLPALEMSDGPAGVRSNAKFPSTTYAAGIGLAATWNRELAERIGEGIGKDARARGIHFMLGPGVNIYRSPRNGRNFEYFGEDPFLASAIAVGYIQGMQKRGVSATVKHFLGNNSEFERHDSDSIIDERTLREIYLPVFEAAVKQGHVGAIMDSYNLVNGLHITQNGYFNTEVARKDWRFDGVMMSDWVATYDAVGAANGGLDLEMPTGAFMNRANLLPAVRDGRVKQATIDEKVRRILMTAARFGWLDREQTDLSLSKYSEPNHQLALDAARQSMVLLKNEGSLLPLDKSKIKKILVVGPDAYPAVPVGGGSGRGIPFAPVSILEGISGYAGTGITVYYERGLPTIAELAGDTSFVTAPQGGERGLKQELFSNADLLGTPVSTQTVRHIDDRGKSWGELDIDMDTLGELFAGPQKATSRRWTGYYVASQAGTYGVVLQGSGEGSGYRLYIDDKLVIDDWKPVKAFEDQAVLELSAGPHKVVAEDFLHGPIGGRLRVAIVQPQTLVSETAKALAKTADVVIVAAGYDNDSESEGSDRTFTLPIGQDELIRELAAQNQRCVVALTAGGSADASRWIDRVPAFIEMWYPGEQGGKALAEVLFGEVNPSGHLPITFERKEADNPTFANYYEEAGSKRVVYKEGVFVGYRGYEHNRTKPLFPFGFGLSYTTFKYKDLAVRVGAKEGEYIAAFKVANTGKREGAAVTQLYVSAKTPSIPRPPKELRAFKRVTLKPGEIREVTLELGPRSFAYFDVGGKQWKADAGEYSIQIGQSSDDIVLEQPLNLRKQVLIPTGGD